MPLPFGFPSVCPYSQIAKYKGYGDSNGAANFTPPQAKTTFRTMDHQLTTLARSSKRNRGPDENPHHRFSARVFSECQAPHRMSRLLLLVHDFVAFQAIRPHIQNSAAVQSALRALGDAIYARASCVSFRNLRDLQSNPYSP